MVDHANNISYFHMIKGTSNTETVSTKDANKRVMFAYGHGVDSYYEDNSRFDSKEFQDSCKLAQQTFSYCGVGAHHQNGIAENMNKCLSHSARTSLLHAIRKWLDVITAVLWPFAYRSQEEHHNHLDLNADCLSPIEVLLGTKRKL
eukprot:13321662-Ditylum_brightwellii.AAC.1